MPFRTRAEPPDTVTLKEGMVTISGGCPPVPAQLRVTPLGTLVRARWLQCGTLTKRVRLRARIDPTCQQMVGGLAAMRPYFKHLFRAARCDDPEVCHRLCATAADCPSGAYCTKRSGRCEERGTCRPRPEACQEIFNPVCGCDGVTYGNYGNACEAAAAGTSIAHAGRCAPSCDVAHPCPERQFCEMLPGICASGLDSGTCVDVPFFCPDVYTGVDTGGPEQVRLRKLEPVCGCDGLTYTSDCYRRAAQVQKSADGSCGAVECRDDCNCYETRTFSVACPLLCPNCGSFWTCTESQCIEHCGMVPFDQCNALCTASEQCPADAFCQKAVGRCDGLGACQPRPQDCPDVVDPVCGCDGRTYSNACDAANLGVSIAHRGQCQPMCGTIAGIACPEGQFCEYPPATCSFADHEGMCLPLPEACPAVHEPVCGCDGITYGNDCERQRARVTLAHNGVCEL